MTTSLHEYEAHTWADGRERSFVAILVDIVEDVKSCCLNLLIGAQYDHLESGIYFRFSVSEAYRITLVNSILPRVTQSKSSCVPRSSSSFRAVSANGRTDRSCSRQGRRHRKVDPR